MMEISLKAELLLCICVPDRVSRLVEGVITSVRKLQSFCRETLQSLIFLISFTDVSASRLWFETHTWFQNNPLRGRLQRQTVFVFLSLWLMDTSLVVRFVKTNIPVLYIKFYRIITGFERIHSKSLQYYKIEIKDLEVITRIHLL